MLDRVINMRGRGARGALGIDFDLLPTAAQFLTKAPGSNPRKFVGVTPVGTPADAVALTDLTSANGASLVGYQRDENAEVESQSDINRRFVWAESYGLKPENTANQNRDAIYRAINALSDRGGTVFMLPRHYVIGSVRLPVNPKVVSIQGAGEGTILEIGTIGEPLFCRDGESYSDGRITGAKIGNFTILAGVGSEKTDLAHTGIEFTGFCQSEFHDITYLSNGSYALGAVLSAESRTGPTYSNVIRAITVAATLGPSRVLRLHNGGGGSLANPNLTEFRDSFIYACSGISVIADVSDSTRTKIDNVLFEDCPGAVGSSLGQATLITACWFELIATNIYTDNTKSVDGSGSIIMCNYFSGAGTSFIDTINIKPLWIGNSGGGQTVTGQGVTRIEGGYGSNGGFAPSPPTLARTEGSETSTFTEIQRETVIPLDAVGNVTFLMRYQIAAATTGYMVLTLSIPTGYTLQQWDLGCVRSENGIPCLVGLTTNHLAKSISFISTDVHELAARVTLKRN